MRINGKNISFRRYLEQRLTDRGTTHNGFHDITPYHLLETLETAKEEMNCSNYDCNNIDRVIEILIRHCEQNGIKID